MESFLSSGIHKTLRPVAQEPDLALLQPEHGGSERHQLRRVLLAEGSPGTRESYTIRCT